MDFGITKETRSSAVVPMPVVKKDDGGNYVFPQGMLTDVVFTKEFEKKDGDKVPILEFVFEDFERSRMTRKSEWPVDSNKDNAQKLLDYMKSRIKHIYETYAEFPEDGIGTGAASFEEYFEAVAIAFNGKTKKSRPIYKSEEDKFIPVWLKFIYGYNNTPDFPPFPNFIQKIEAGKACMLTVNESRDKLTQKATPKKGGGMPTGAPDLPDVPGSDLPDIPG